MLPTVLAELDVAPDEARIYALLLETGPIAVGKLASKLGQPRSSLYGMLKRLQDKGLVTQSIRDSVKIYAAQDPAQIHILFQQKIEALKVQQTEYKKLLPQLLAQSGAKLLTPKFQLYEGEDGLKTLLHDMLLHRDIETASLWPIKAMVAILSPEFFRYHNKERIRNRLYTRAVWPANQTIDESDFPYLGSGEEFYREIRIAPPHMDFSMGYWVYADKVAFISSKKESFGFMIQSRELVELLMTQFEIVWAISKPLTASSSEQSKRFLKEVERED
jgi:sugar-specific transcriptional regulator TrmB